MRRRTGFTLTELLVVIAIIAILAAIAIMAILAVVLFPIFAREQRENARQTSCLGNTKQMGLATMMYCQDYDGKYPGYVAMCPRAPSGRSWAPLASSTATCCGLICSTRT